MRVVDASPWFERFVTVPPATARAESPESPELPLRPQNLDFEQQSDSGTPPGWILSGTARGAGYTTEISGEGPYEGRKCLRFGGDPGPGPPGFGTVVQRIDAAAYRGKRIRFEAAVRTTPPTRAQLWFRVDREGGRGATYDLGDRPITGASWDVYGVVGEVAEDAVGLNFGLLIPGSGEAWMDAASLTVLETPEPTQAPPRPLSDRGLANLVAFARLVGYVRYFHPSDGAANMSWDRFVMAGVSDVEDAEDDRTLAAALRRLFHPIAPSVQILTGTDTDSGGTPVPEMGSPDIGVVAWIHRGVGTGYGPAYCGVRSPDGLVEHERAWVLQEVDASALRGQRARFEVSARVELQDPAAKAEVWVAAPEIVGIGSSRAAEPVVGDAWSRYTVELCISATAVSVGVGATLCGRGRLRVDDARLLVIDADGEATEIPLENAGFEEEGDERTPAGWDAARESPGPYDASIVEDGASEGRCLAITSVEQRTDGVPRLGETYEADLGGGVRCVVPLALPVDGEGTLPRVSSAGPDDPTLPRDFFPSGNDRRTRIADVILLWNVFQHFYPYFDVVDTDWPSVLRTSLQRAATDPDEGAFNETLRLLVAELHDGHGNVFSGSNPFSRRLPFTWDWIEEQLVITHGPQDAGKLDLSPGDVVLGIDGESTEAAVAKVERYISSATPQFHRFRALRVLALGPEHEQVTLDIRSPDGTERQVTARRTAPSWGKGMPKEPRPDKVAEIADGIFYLDLNEITDADFTQVVTRLAKARAVIFDMRSGPMQSSPVAISHLTEEPVTSAQWHVPRVMRPDRSDMTFDVTYWTVKPKEPRFQGRVVFITDGRAFSCAETYLGIIEHYELAEIVGGPTAGTNGDMNRLVLPGSYRVYWTGLRVLKHDGSQHHGVGIQPTIPVSRTIAGVTDGRDELLEAAVRAVSG